MLQQILFKLVQKRGLPERFIRFSHRILKVGSDLQRLSGPALPIPLSNANFKVR